MDDKRPTLPELRVGDRLTARYNQRRRHRDVEIQIVRLGRLYAYGIPVEYVDNPNRWSEIKFNGTTGYIHGGNYPSPGRVLTDEQQAFDERVQAAEEWLAANVVRSLYEFRAEWKDEPVLVANLFRRHLGLDDL